jgi:hypothetical protein
MYQTLLCLSLLAPAADPCNGPCDGASVCVKEPTVKKVPHTCYSSKCVEYCYPHPTIFGVVLFGASCKDCSEVRVKKVLVKKVTIEEKCEMKCMPRPEGVCAPGIIVK